MLIYHHETSPTQSSIPLKSFMSLKRRDFLFLFSASFTTVAVGSCQKSTKLPLMESFSPPKSSPSLPFKPIKGPLPNASDLLNQADLKVMSLKRFIPMELLIIPVKPPLY